jgi:two-component system OmpR family response regulator
MATIAVIDTDPDTAALIGFVLHQQGHTVLAVSDLTAALPTVARAGSDLVLLAVTVDGMQSLDLCRALRAIIAAPILLYNGRSNEDDEIRALDNGANVYMCAPLDLRMLRARTRALLRRADAARPPIPSA